MTGVTSLIPNPKSLITRVADSVIAALLAPACAVCSTLVDEPLSGCVCRNCWNAIRPITPPLCDGCGDPLSRGDDVCEDCGRSERAVTRARAIGQYDGVLRDVIHSFKYDKRHSLARPLAHLMRVRGAAVLEAADCIIPVPLHWRREYQRGFNQSRALSQHLGLPVLNALARTRHTRAQVELAADRRYSNVANAFALRGRWQRHINGARVVIVDDVSTTGATLESCAHVLKAFGASEVYALTAARVVARRRHGQSQSPIHNHQSRTPPNP